MNYLRSDRNKRDSKIKKIEDIHIKKTDANLRLKLTELKAQCLVIKYQLNVPMEQNQSRRV